MTYLLTLIYCSKNHKFFFEKYNLYNYIDIIIKN